MKEIKTKADILEFDFELSNANIKLPKNLKLLVILNKKDFIKIQKKDQLKFINGKYQNFIYKTPSGNNFEIMKTYKKDLWYDISELPQEAMMVEMKDARGYSENVYYDETNWYLRDNSPLKERYFSVWRPLKLNSCELDHNHMQKHGIVECPNCGDYYE